MVPVPHSWHIVVICSSLCLSSFLFSPIPDPLSSFVLAQLVIGNSKEQRAKSGEKIVNIEYQRADIKYLVVRLLYILPHIVLISRVKCSWKSSKTSREQKKRREGDLRFQSSCLHLFRSNRLFFVVLLYFSPGFMFYEKNHEQVESRQEYERVIFGFNLQIFICSKLRESCMLFVLLFFRSSF